MKTTGISKVQQNQYYQMLSSTILAPQGVFDFFQNITENAE